MIFTVLGNLKHYINNYRRRGGVHVFFSTLFAQGAAFILALVVTRMLPKNVYGSVTYAKSIVVAVLPFAGFAVQNALLRHGSIAGSDAMKRGVFLYSFKKGLFFSFLMLFGLLFVTNMIRLEIPDSQKYVNIMAFQVVTSFLLLSTQSYARVLEKNKIYAYSMFINCGVILFIGILLTYLLQGTGLMIVYVLAPFTGFLYLLWRVKSIRKGDSESYRGNRNFWLYGLYLGIGSLASQLIYSVDIIQIGSILGDEVSVANYEVASKIPIHMIFIPLAIITTDFVKIAKNFKDPAFLKKYAKAISVLLFLIGIGSAVFLFITSRSLLSIAFGEKYAVAKDYLRILSIALIGAFALREPLGSILSAVGKASWNFLNALFMVALNFILNIIFIEKYGTIGAAYATAISIWIAGIVALFMFIYYLKSIKNKTKDEMKTYE
jgi:O-antigen/teichoic acid export membrane protein